MPMFELQATRAGRFLVFFRAQLPLLLGALFIAVSSAVAFSGSLDAGLALAGLGIIAIASVAAVVVPWEKSGVPWSILVAVVDIVGVAFMRAELFSVLPSVGMLVIFPVLWLSFGFGRVAAAIAVAGTIFVTLFTFVADGLWPSTGAQWLSVVTLPALLVGVVVVVHLAATHLRHNLLRLAEADREQAAAMQRALDNEVLSRSILDTVNAGVAFYSASNELTLSNEHAREMTAAAGFALDAPPYAGENVLAADRATPIPLDQQIIPRALRGELIEDHQEWLGPPGQQAAIMATSRPVHRLDGTRLGTVIMAYDITDIASGVAAREAFLGTVSHELRTPLTSVLGYLELIADEVHPSQTDIHTYLEIVRRNMSRLGDRIAEMHSAAESDILLHISTTDLTSLVAACVARASEHAVSRDITLVNTVTSAATLTADPMRVSQALSELLANAIKFSRVGTSVHIDRRDTPEGAELIVSDEGPSMTSIERARAFDRFYRTQYARDQAVQGFGLGLFVVKNIMDAHGGTVTIGGRPESGTQVTLAFPAGPQQ